MNALPARQRGVALLVALLVVALAVILMAALLDRGELALARTRNLLRAEQAEAYAQGVEAYAARALEAARDQDGGMDTSASAWAVPLPPQPVPGGLIAATVRDRNGCFNLNNLAPARPDAAQWLALFRRLLGVLALREDIAQAARDWQDPQASASAYLAQPVPYRPRGGPFAHVSELRLLRGMDGAAYARLAPWVCALPAGTRLNVNTAGVPLLQALGLPEALARRLWNRGQARFASVADFGTAAGVPLQMPVSALDVGSQYFLARADVALDDIPFVFYSLIERVPGRPIRVIARSHGGDGGATPVAGVPDQ
jgi:general secretion pathway protein K